MSEEMKKSDTAEVSAMSGFAAMTNMDILSEAMNDDCAGLDFQLDRIKLPSGGMTAFEVPAGDGENTELAKVIEGVILYNHPAYAYYRESYKGGSNPPDCGSFDGMNGVGDPGGNCRNCPYNEFGSGQGKSKACKNRRMLYILRENEIFPMMLNLPTGSLKVFTKYVQSLLTHGKRPNQVVTSISLRKASNSGGIDFSQAVFKVVRALNVDEQKNINSMTEQMKAYAENLTTAALTDDAAVVDVGSGEVIEPLR